MQLSFHLLRLMPLLPMILFPLLLTKLLRLFALLLLLLTRQFHLMSFVLQLIKIQLDLSNLAIRTRSITRDQPLAAQSLPERILSSDPDDEDGGLVLAPIPFSSN